MIATASDAKTHLEAKSLHGSNRISSLWIVATVRDVADGVMMSNDACSPIENADGWVAVFPAEGLCTYELPGTLEELVSTISAVYDPYRRVGGPSRMPFDKPSMTRIDMRSAVPSSAPALTPAVHAR